MEEKEKKGGNGFFHFKSHFVQSQMTVFKDALSLSPQDFWTAVPSLMVRYLSRSLPSSLLAPLFFSPHAAVRALLFSGTTLF